MPPPPVQSGPVQSGPAQSGPVQSGPAQSGPVQSGDADGPVQLLVQRLDAGLPLPTYAHPGDAGADLHARTDVTLAPGSRATVPTGLAVAVPPGWAAFVHPRSGLAARHGVTVLNGPGTVDAGYRGEVAVTLVNTDSERPVTIHRGDRIAQLVLQRVGRALLVEVDELPPSARAAGGHGSTGGLAGAGGG